MVAVTGTGPPSVAVYGELLMKVTSARSVVMPVELGAGHTQDRFMPGVRV
jgi:hypothetical protein